MDGNLLGILIWSTEKFGIRLPCDRVSLEEASKRASWSWVLQVVRFRCWIYAIRVLL